MPIADFDSYWYVALTKFSRALTKQAADVQAKINALKGQIRQARQENEAIKKAQLASERENDVENQNENQRQSRTRAQNLLKIDAWEDEIEVIAKTLAVLNKRPTTVMRAAEKLQGALSELEDLIEAGESDRKTLDGALTALKTAFKGFEQAQSKLAEYAVELTTKGRVPERTLRDLETAAKNIAADAKGRIKSASCAIAKVKAK